MPMLFKIAGSPVGVMLEHGSTSDRRLPPAMMYAERLASTAISLPFSSSASTSNFSVAGLIVFEGEPSVHPDQTVFAR